MNQDNKKHPTCHCEYCNCEIPTSAALTAEGKDYMYYFCGTDCYKRWESEKKQDDK